MKAARYTACVLAAVLATACADTNEGNPEVGSDNAALTGSVEGRFISVVAHTDVLVEGDEICFLVMEPSVGKFVAFYDASRAACFHSGVTTERALDLSLRGKILRANAKPIVDPAVQERIDATTRFYDLPPRTQFVEFGSSYTIVGDVGGGELHEYGCRRTAEVFDPMESTSLFVAVNSETMRLGVRSSDRFVGVPDSRYRPRAADVSLRRFNFGYAEAPQCEHGLRVTIDQSAFAGAASVPLRAECPGNDTPSWSRFTCTIAP